MQAQALLAGEPKPNTAEADIALAFQQSALKSTAETDALFGAVALRWLPADRGEDEGGPPVWHPSRCAAVSVPRYDAWDGLFLECAVEWPLQLLFPPEVSASSQRGAAQRPPGLGAAWCRTVSRLWAASAQPPVQACPASAKAVSLDESSHVCFCTDSSAVFAALHPSTRHLEAALPCCVVRR